MWIGACCLGIWKPRDDTAMTAEFPCVALFIPDWVFEVTNLEMPTGKSQKADAKLALSSSISRKMAAKQDRKKAFRQALLYSGK